MTIIPGRTPWHLWVVGFVALIWHAGGAFDYIQVQSADANYLAAMGESYGLSAAQIALYYDSWSVFGNIFWAIGIWAGVAGSVLLLLKSRFAFHAFLASIAGMAATLIYRFINPLEGVEVGAVEIVGTIAFFLITALLIRYSKVMTQRGVLR